jgi:hypothetical protein
MMNFGYDTDNLIDDLYFLPTELKDCELIDLERFSEMSKIVELDEEVSDFDDKGGFMLEDITSGYEIYNMA